MSAEPGRWLAIVAAAAAEADTPDSAAHEAAARLARPLRAGAIYVVPLEAARLFEVGVYQVPATHRPEEHR